MVRVRHVLPATAALGLATAAAPALASAAPAVAPATPCAYVGIPLGLTASGLQPGQQVKLGTNVVDAVAATADAAGNAAATVPTPSALPDLTATSTPVPVGLFDAFNAPLAMGTVTLAEPKVLISEREYSARSRIAFTATGFTPGAELYVHVRRGSKWLRTKSLGIVEPDAACVYRTKVAYLKGLAFKGRLANLRLYIDQSKTPSDATRPQGKAYATLRRPVGGSYYRYATKVRAGSARFFVGAGPVS